MNKSSLYKNLPETPGVYLMKNKRGELLYVGKAGNLRRRVSSYFLLARRSLGGGGRPQDDRIERLVEEVAKIDFQKTDTAIEALILEAELIKRHLPPFNVKDKDDKSFLYVEITKEKFPRVLLLRGKETKIGKHGVLYGPFTSASSIREALRIIRKIFPYSVHDPEKKFTRGCFDYEIGLCPGVCAGTLDRREYLKTVKNIKLFFKGKKKKILSSLKKEMIAASKNLDFEKAQKLRGQIFSLEHIQDVALIKDNDMDGGEGGTKYRIEGYDISNISGTAAVGSMAVFINEEPDKNEYRKFKIRTIMGANDTGMLKEVLRRRFKNSWPLPSLILIDGGRPQINAAKEIVSEAGLAIPVVGIAKGPERKRNDILGTVPDWASEKTLIRVRDEAHRFAISYHKNLRSREFLR